MNKVFAEIDDKRKYIEIYFKYDPFIVNVMNKCRATFVPPEKDGPYWRIPLDFEEARYLAQQIGKDHLELGAALTEFGRREKAREQMIFEILQSDNGKLDRLPKVLPKLYKTLFQFQKSGIRYGTFVDNPLIGDHPGLGKTLEAIGIVFESGTDEGPNLVVAPITALETVWEHELRLWQPHPVFIAAEKGMNKAKREEILAEAKNALDAGFPFWLVVNPDMVRIGVEKTEDTTTEYSKFPFLHETEWANVVIDECHRNAVRHPNTLTARGMYKLRIREGGKKIALSGTPMGGKAINLWGPLHFLNPDKFRSKWRWAGRWLEISENRYGAEIGPVRRGEEEAFRRHLAPYILRRTKEEVLKELPPKQRVDVWCNMTDKQAAQYKKFAAFAQIKIDEENISATSILAEYVRLKQFAGAMQEVRKGTQQLYPTSESGKLPALFERLDELGILDGEGEEQAVVFSQFSRLAGMVYEQLQKKKVPTLFMTGDTNKKGERPAIQRSFQAGEARVLVMTTLTGGQSITLDRASHVFILDETWNPDDQEQAEDRCHRASRIHQVTCYYLRSRGTIEEYIQGVNLRKDSLNREVLKGIRLL